MPLEVARLPPDIIIIICVHLHPKDLLSFIQTCRVIHALGSTDYVWHQINIDYELSLDADGQLVNLSGSEIRSSVIRTLKLNENWNKRVSKVFRINKFHPRNAVLEMQSLGRNWLVTSHRSRGSSIKLSVWRLDVSPGDMLGAAATRVIDFEPASAFSFKTILEKNRDNALVSVLGGSTTSPHKGQWTIYHLNLKGCGSSDRLSGREPLNKLFAIELSGVPYYTQISGSIAAAAVVRVDAISSSHYLILLNTITNAILKIETHTLTNFDCGRLQFKIYPPYVVIVGTILEKIKVQVRKLPRDLFSDLVHQQCVDEDTISTVEWEAHIVDYETEKISNLEFCIPEEPIYGSSPGYLTVMVNHSPFSTMENGTVDIFRFPLDGSRRNLQFTKWKPTHTFFTHPNVSLEPVCLGKTGTRAVWLSHHWNTDEYQIMKGCFPSTGNGPPLVVPLQPPEMALPFESRDCRALTFEEATGRLFVGVHTGEVYILEFNQK